MMRVAHTALAVGLAAVLAVAGQPPKAPAKAEPEAAPTPAQPKVWIVAQDKAPLMYGNEQIGELQEGTRVKLLQAREPWVQIRADFGDNWIQGWIRTAMLVPDSLEGVGVQIGRATLEYTFQRRTLPNHQFLVVPVRFIPTDKGPSRLYFRFADQADADLYLRYGREHKVLPYGYLRARPRSTRRYFEADEKKQLLLLTPGQPRVETYIFAVPIRAAGFELVLKSRVRPVRLGR